MLVPISSSPQPARDDLLSDLSRRYLLSLQSSARATAAVLRLTVCDDKASDELVVEVCTGEETEHQVLQGALDTLALSSGSDENLAFDDPPTIVGLPTILVLAADNGHIAMSRDTPFSSSERRFLTVTAQTGLQVLTSAYCGPSPNTSSSRSQTAFAPAGSAAVESALDRALEENRIHLVYQPEFELLTGRVLALEALLRWDDEALTAQRLDEVIALAEQTGRIAILGERVLSAALRQLEQWRANLPPFTWSLAVNISASQLDDAFIELVRTELLHVDVDPSQLCLEITEHSPMRLPELEPLLAALRDLGVNVALDDVGTGHNSLNRIAQAPLDIIKIDRSFVAGMLTDPAHHAVVDSIVTLGRERELDVIAEGVETPDEARALVAVGCNQAQGYLLCRPASPQQLDPLLRTGALADERLREYGLSR